MRIKMIEIYATLILAYLEENLYENIGRKYGKDIKMILVDHGEDT